MRISDWSSDVCSSDLAERICRRCGRSHRGAGADRAERSARGARAREIGSASCKGKSVSVRVDLGGRRIIKKKKKSRQQVGSVVRPTKTTEDTRARLIRTR